MEVMRQAIYRDKLLVNARDIRVIDIEPADDYHAPIRCSLRIISLDEHKDKYQTLSYAWGSGEDTEWIVCDDRLMTITKDLDQALRRIREKFAPRDILSRTIYKRSQRLIIWLGEANQSEIDGFKSALQDNSDDSSKARSFMPVLQRLWFQRRWVIQEVIKSRAGSRHVY